MTKPFRAQDKYYKKAKQQGKRARSFFKLETIDQKHPMLYEGMHILDLGAAPGSFMQYTLQMIGAEGRIVGVDLQKMQPLGHPGQVTMIQGDIFSEEVRAQVKEAHPKKFDGIVSDLAPAMSGVKDVDHWKSIELSEEVLSYTREMVRPGGFVVLKIFQGSDYDQFVRFMKGHFKKFHVVKPPSSRDRSKEVFLVGRGFLPKKPKKGAK